MKKIYLILIALVTLSSLQSCEKKEGDGDTGPIHFIMLINKHSDLYKDMEKAFAKNDYTNHTAEDEFAPGYDGEENGFNNVYFLKGEYKCKLLRGFQNSSSPHDITSLLYKTVKISKDYVYLFFVDYKLTNKIITGKEEDFLLKYDNKEIPLKIKGRFDKEYGQFIYIDDLYIAGNKAKMVSSGIESEQIIFYLTE